MEENNPQDIASQDIAQETPAQDVFIAPSIHQQAILAGASYTHHSAIPQIITENISEECVLGVDEAGRGPVLGNLSQCFTIFHKHYSSFQAPWSMVCSTSL